MLLYEDLTPKIDIDTVFVDFNLTNININKWNEFVPSYRSIVESDPIHVYSGLPENVSGFIIKEDGTKLESVNFGGALILDSEFIKRIELYNKLKMERMNVPTSGPINGDTLRKYMIENCDRVK